LTEAAAPLSQRKRLAFRLIMWTIAVAVTLIGLEILSAAYIVLRERKYVAPKELFERTSNSFIRDLTEGRGTCRYVDTLFPHPYLAFVHHGNPPCGLSGINNIGLFGDDFPFEKRQDRFVILLTGGSVAAQSAYPICDVRRRGGRRRNARRRQRIAHAGIDAALRVPGQQFHDR
jgi:hypothetical protein